MHRLALPDGALSTAVPPGTLLLVSGPATNARDRFPVGLLAGGHADGDRGVVVSTREGPSTLFRRVRAGAERVGDFDPARVGIVHGAEAVDSLLPEGLVAAKRAGRVQRLDSLTEFAAIGTAVSRALAATDDADRYWLLFDSLSDIVDRADATVAYKFAHVLGDRLGQSSGVGVCTLDDGHQPETRRLLARAADAVIETRPADKFDDGDCEFRVRGLDGVDDGWCVADTEPDEEEEWPSSERERERAWRRREAYRELAEEE